MARKYSKPSKSSKSGGKKSRKVSKAKLTQFLAGLRNEEE